MSFKDNDPPKSVSVWHPYLGRVFALDGQTWKVRRVQMLGTALWAFIVNEDDPQDQRRFSIKALDELD